MGPDNESNNDTVDSKVSDSMSSTDLPIDLGDFFQLLVNEQTRYVLYLLMERGGTVPLEDINDYYDNESDKFRFHHTVIPRLVDFHIIDFNQETRAITPTLICDDLTPALETIKTLERESADEFLEQVAR